jgi:2-hydroxy-3-keto-5-methylthiopentenyl-1-phosphate phosphatase
MTNQRIVFCDFDGTITAIETFAGMLKEFAPRLSAELMPLMYARKLSLREGVRQILESIPSSCYTDMINYAEDKPIRSGLAELLDFLNIQGIPFIIVSGGLRDMVEAVLKQVPTQPPLLEQVESIFAVDIDASGKYLLVNSEFEADTELVAKAKVMEKYPARETIAIGDSLTDINMALKADIVFARDRLIDYLEAEGKPYIPWNNFFDVRDQLQQVIIKDDQ